MSNYAFLSAAIAATCSTALGVGAADSIPAETQPVRPNILFLISDDLNVDLASYGHSQVKTPNLDKLRERSMVFRQAYCQYPLCNPSRNSFLSGLYPGTSGNLSNDKHLRDTAPDAVTMPQFFKANGYRTISSGKVFHHEDPGAWSQISDLRSGGLLPEGKEYRFYFPPFGDEGKTVGEGRLLVDNTVPWFQWRSVTENEEFLIDNRIATATINRMNEVAVDNVPFFLAAGFSRPHDPYFAPKRFFDLYPLETMQLPQTPGDASAIPAHAFHSIFKTAFDSMSEQDKREAMRAYYAGISYMDEQVGRVLDRLEATGLASNTVIVFIGDNGYQVGEKNYWNKGVVFERSCRAPLMIAVPGMKTAGETCSRIVEFVDIYPTLADLCGLTPPSALEGISLVPNLMNPDAPRKEIAYSYCNSDRSVRDVRYRYSVWSGGGHALYDHDRDPDEHYNLADNPEYAPIVARMQALIKAMPEPKKPQ